MQTKLRAILLLLSVGLLWTSLMSAATRKTKAQNLSTAMVHFVGIASWYGKEHQGHKMANGERFDRHKLTAACWFFPLGSQVRVKNLKNNEEIVVWITDRGPAAGLHRIIDLSEEAAKQLGFWGNGTTAVFLQPVLQLKTESTPIESRLTEPWTFWSVLTR